MISFPSALNRGGNNAITTNKGAQQAVSINQYDFDVSRMRAFNLSLNKSTKKELLKESNMNIARFNRYQQLVNLGDANNAIDAQAIAEQAARLNLRKNNEYYENERDIAKMQNTLNTKNARVQNLEQQLATAQQQLNSITGSGSDAKQKRSSAQKTIDKIQNELNDARKDAQPTEDYNKLISRQQEIINNEINKQYDNMSNKDSSIIQTKKSYYENPFKLPSDIIATMNRYKHVYKVPTQTLYDAGVPSGMDVSEENIELSMIATVSVPSMFNPLCNIQAVGMTDNLPLLNDVASTKAVTATIDAGGEGGTTQTVNVTTNLGVKISDRDITNCSIRELVSLSHEKNSILGMARYKYADFMYCKDVGKVSNNHMITLRKFKHPVGDNIFRTSTFAYANEVERGLFDYTNDGDCGRLITWFDTDDNKLEDILNYKYSASWKELNAKIEQVQSEEDAEERGPLGMLLNSVNPAYNKATLAGMGGTHNLFSQYGARWFNIKQGGNSQNTKMQTLYDSNKVYTPKNTIQDTHIYEGKLQFDHEITLKFSYRLRAYDNINPKTAFLDLLANILEVTYRRGEFWGGSRRFIGSPANRAGWNKANKFIDEQWDKLGGFLNGLASGVVDFQSIVQSAAAAVDALKNAAVGFVNNMQDAAQGGAKGVMQSLLQGMIKLNKRTGFTHGLKAQLKNAIGRPAMYAMDSLLSADNVGLWHITIGNPKNPIMVMGNMILTGASIQHKGPLGVDDFPTELTVTVSLKPGRSRDLTEIGRMYTKGAGALYQTVDRASISHFYDYTNGPGSENDIENQMLKHSQEANEKRKQAQQAKKQNTTTSTKDGQSEKSDTKNKSVNDDTYDTNEKSWLDNIVQNERIDNPDEVVDYANMSPIVKDDFAMRVETHNQVTDLMLRLNMDELN